MTNRYRRSGSRRARRMISSSCAMRVPRARPGMPEAGYLTIPRKLAPARREGYGAPSPMREMSGTDFGTIVFHIAPGTAVGGPLGPRARRRYDQPRCRDAAVSDLDVAEDELARRRADFAPPPHMAGPQRGYRGLYLARGQSRRAGLRLRFPAQGRGDLRRRRGPVAPASADSPMGRLVSGAG